jgi:hypothetical protein
MAFTILNGEYTKKGSRYYLLCFRVSTGVSFAWRLLHWVQAGEMGFMGMSTYM